VEALGGATVVRVRRLHRAAARLRERTSEIAEVLPIGLTRPPHERQIRVGQFHHICTVCVAGSGGYVSVIDGHGGPDTSTNPGIVEPVDVVGYR
jgi:hypothetical protein